MLDGRSAEYLKTKSYQVIESIHKYGLKKERIIFFKKMFYLIKNVFLYK